MVGRGVAGLLILPVVASVAIAQQVRVEAITRTTPGGTARGLVAVVDLADPTVAVRVTGPAPAGSGFEASLLRTDTWRTQVGARLAINANFYSTLTSTTADIVGASKADGVLVSPPRSFGGLWDPGLAFDAAGLARAAPLSPTDVASAVHAVAGVGGSGAEVGTLLVSDGVNLGSTARVEPSVRHPRTAAGVTRDGRQLILAVVDGRQPNWSVGMTLPELGAILIEYGADDAVNLDGGGSSSMIFQPVGGPVVQNRPSDGAFRAVANHLGIVVDGLTTDRTTRPIRGAWLRPPSTIAAFETTVASIAQAGIQDLYLETLYWGRDTGLTGVFPSRFGYDYLRQAIRVAAKYGVRVHAWCETGYLDFGTSPSAILQQNPGWIVRHRDPATATTGDIANQRFVNLGNPGVRAMLAAYFAELAADYPGLEGIQADYHFYPLAGSGAAVWSFDEWGVAAYQARYGVDPRTEVTLSGGGSTARWLQWNRDNITDALVILRDAVDAAPSPPVFSAVAFAAWDSATHTSKCIDLPAWGRRAAADHYFVMAYFTSTSAIDSDLAKARTSLPGKRIIAGLANLTNQTRPTITQQLTTARNRGIEDFSWFDAPTLVANQSMRDQLRSFLDAVATPQRSDINRDGYIDARDAALMARAIAGDPELPAAQRTRADVNLSGAVDATDRAIFDHDLARFRFGEDGVVDGSDLAALRECFTAATGSPPWVLHRWDLDGDGDVDYADQTILHASLTVSLPPDTDADGNGRLTVEDLYTHWRAPIDVNRDGVLSAADAAALEQALRNAGMLP